MLQLTQKAAEKIRYFAQTMPEADGKALRIFIEGGGCSGFQYGITFDDQQEGDTVVEAHGITVLVDPFSASYLNGATVDFIEDVRGSGFVVDNPNMMPTCGCGSSCAAE